MIVAVVVIWMALQFPVAVLIGRMIDRGQHLRLTSGEGRAADDVPKISRIDGCDGCEDLPAGSLTGPSEDSRGRIHDRKEA